MNSNYGLRSRLLHVGEKLECVYFSRMLVWPESRLENVRFSERGLRKWLISSAVLQRWKLPCISVCSILTTVECSLDGKNETTVNPFAEWLWFCREEARTLVTFFLILSWQDRTSNDAAQGQTGISSPWIIKPIITVTQLLPRSPMTFSPCLSPLLKQDRFYQHCIKWTTLVLLQG